MHVSRETTPYGRRRDEAVGSALADDGRELVATGHAVCRRAGSRRQPVRLAVQGLHALLEGLAPARAARTGRPPEAHPVVARRRAQRRPARELRATSRPGEKPPRCKRWEAFLHERAHGIRQGARPTRPRHDEPAVGGAEVRRDPPAHHARRHRGALGGRSPGAEHLRHRAHLARVLCRRALAPPRVGVARPAARARRSCPTTTARDRPARRRVARGAHRLPDRRRGHAPAPRGGVDAQPAADDHAAVPNQTSEAIDRDRETRTKWPASRSVR